MRNRKKMLVIFSLIAFVTISQCTKTDKSVDATGKVSANEELSAGQENMRGHPNLVEQGKNIFRFDAFGDEAFWSGLLHIDKAIAGAANGGFGMGVSPATALSVGLKVDVNALPSSIIAGIRSGSIDLNDPATTIALLKLNAVVGINGSFNPNGTLKAIGITCASCHSTVDNSFAAGIGKRLDGWPNRDLNVGAIISLTDNAQPIADMLHVSEPTLRQVLSKWGPGKFPAILFMDGKAFRPDGKIAANLIPAAFGLKGVNLTTYTGWGDISYWNSFVANLEMHGKGNFTDQRLNNPSKYPIAVENSFYHVVNNPDLITSKLPALRAYQHSLDVPEPPSNSYDKHAAVTGKMLFFHKAKCGTCHSAPLYTDNELHKASEIGIDDFEANRSPTGKYRTTPLRALFVKVKGGFYHDGRFEKLTDVVNYYNRHFHLGLTWRERHDLVEYLKSL